MVGYLELVLTVREGNVSIDERNLINVGFRNLINSKQEVLRRKIRPIEQTIEQNPKYAKFNAALMVYKERI